jgi:hypothetical protein
MKNLFKPMIILFVGIFLGYVGSKKITFEDESYVELPCDYSHKELGLIKKGTKLKCDQDFSEGFTRYILYLNIHDSQHPTLSKENATKEIIPYWIEKNQ